MKKQKTTKKTKFQLSKLLGFGLEVNGVIYYFDEFDKDALEGLKMFKEISEKAN